MSVIAAVTAVPELRALVAGLVGYAAARVVDGDDVDNMSIVRVLECLSERV